jgi:hypothetical protein
VKSKEKNSLKTPKYCQELGLWIARLPLARDEKPKHLRIQLSKRPRDQIAYISVGSEAYNDIEYCNTWSNP